MSLRKQESGDWSPEQDAEDAMAFRWLLIGLALFWAGVIGMVRSCS
jgi:hypothetical protein